MEVLSEILPNKIVDDEVDGTVQGQESISHCVNVHERLRIYTEPVVVFRTNYQKPCQCGRYLAQDEYGHYSNQHAGEVPNDLEFRRAVLLLFSSLDGHKELKVEVANNEDGAQ